MFKREKTLKQEIEGQLIYMEDNGLRDSEDYKGYVELWEKLIKDENRTWNKGLLTGFVAGIGGIVLANMLDKRTK